MTLDEMRTKAYALREEINSILGEMKSEDFPREAVNWGDIGCVTVGIVLTDDPISWEATLEEAAPGCFKFASHIQEELSQRGYKDVWVRTEW